ncbi:lipid II flippase MurJ, partial [Clostridium perfringens]|uniref:lipid II flippase MurJ n=1 Tax=Clostridium perfringens TaxID=1502 RepID=UPI0039EA0236
MSRILNTSIVFTIITFISKILGLVRDSLMAHAYGATYITDADNIAIPVPTFFYQVIGAALMTTFIPFFKEQIHKNNKAKGYEFANEILTIMTIIMGIMVLIIAINSELVVKIMAPNFDERTLILTSHLIRLTAINMFFMT